MANDLVVVDETLARKVVDVVVGGLSECSSKLEEALENLSETVMQELMHRVLEAMLE